MKRLYKYITNKYLNKELDFRVQLFNVLAMAGVLVGFFVTVGSMVTGDEWFTVLTDFSTCLLAVFLLIYSTITGKYQICYIITIVAIFLVFFPVIFFIGGGYHSSMPFYFIFAIVFTVFMLDGKKALFFGILELLVYLGLIAASYLYPEAITSLGEEQVVALDIAIGLVIVSVALGVTMYIQIRLYNEQQKQLAERNAELDRINQNKTEFLSNISHELKTPLTVVSSNIQMAQRQLEKTPGTEDLQQTTKLISGEAERMALMVSQLLDISRIDEGRMSIELKRESVVEIIQTTLDTYYPVFSKNHNRLTFKRSGDIPAVRCDQLRVMQVLVNLIGNATRHTKGGELTVIAGILDGMAVITVSDTGEGIEQCRIPHLFERYHSYQSVQSKKARAGWETGTGLGLFICKHIVEAHGGRIRIESEVGKGTQVHFTLPLDTEPAETDSSD